MPPDDDDLLLSSLTASFVLIPQDETSSEPDVILARCILHAFDGPLASDRECQLTFLRKTRDIISEHVCSVERFSSAKKDISKCICKAVASRAPVETIKTMISIFALIGALVPADSAVNAENVFSLSVSEANRASSFGTGDQLSTFPLLGLAEHCDLKARSALIAFYGFAFESECIRKPWHLQPTLDRSNPFFTEFYIANLISTGRFEAYLRYLVSCQGHSFDFVSYTRSALLSLLSIPRLVNAISNSPQESGNQILVATFKALRISGIQGILRSVVHGAAIDKLKSKDEFERLKLYLAILEYHSQTPKGLSELLEFNETTSFSAKRGILTKVNLFVQVCAVATFCSQCMLDLETVELAIAALHLANRIKNKVYDLNLLGVLVSFGEDRCRMDSADEILTESVYLQNRILNNSPLRELSLSCARLFVAARKLLHLRPLHITQNLIVQSIILAELSLSILQDILSVVVHDAKKEKQLGFLAPIAIKLEVNASGFLVCPRYFQTISYTMEVILDTLDANPLDYSYHLALIDEVFSKRLRLVSEKDKLTAELLSAVWMREIFAILPRLSKVITVFGYSSDSSVHSKIKRLFETVARAAHAAKRPDAVEDLCQTFCREIQRNLKGEYDSFFGEIFYATSRLLDVYKPIVFTPDGLGLAKELCTDIALAIKTKKLAQTETVVMLDFILCVVK
ncbi:hypothetical protein HDU82_006253 [Entophlyctis luteolus]|nr:hypothetical protein HDU82_006253 [Entophlyctis luteolus]